jgi:hypothetical protein
MAADFQINLAKDLTSSVEDRATFYNRMLIYLVACAAFLVFVAYFASTNIMKYIDNQSVMRQLEQTTVSVSDVSKEDYKDPETALAELEIYSRRIGKLKSLLGVRVQILPVIHNLFVDLPEEVMLQNLSANRSRITFGMVMPAPSEEDGDLVTEMTDIWEKNEELMSRVVSLRPVTGERRMLGAKPVFFVQFECTLKK